MHHDEITSEELDGDLAGAETLAVDRNAAATAMRLYVAIDAPTLERLERRAAAEGTDVVAVAADVLRDGASAA